ncbi:hypothetical protein COBT_001072, partial [Conglomerata obtusa]
MLLVFLINAYCYDTIETLSIIVITNIDYMSTENYEKFYIMSYNHCLQQILVAKLCQEKLMVKDYDKEFVKDKLNTYLQEFFLKEHKYYFKFIISSLLQIYSLFEMKKNKTYEHSIEIDVEFLNFIFDTYIDFMNKNGNLVRESCNLVYLNVLYNNMMISKTIYYKRIENVRNIYIHVYNINNRNKNEFKIDYNAINLYFEDETLGALLINDFFINFEFLAICNDSEEMLQRTYDLINEFEQIYVDFIPANFKNPRTGRLAFNFTNTYMENISKLKKLFLHGEKIVRKQHENKLLNESDDVSAMSTNVEYTFKANSGGTYKLKTKISEYSKSFKEKILMKPNIQLKKINNLNFYDTFKFICSHISTYLNYRNFLYELMPVFKKSFIVKKMNEAKDIGFNRLNLVNSYFFSKYIFFKNDDDKKVETYVYNCLECTKTIFDLNDHNRFILAVKPFLVQKF